MADPEIERAMEEARKKIDPAAAKDPTGACVYTARTGTYCAVLTQAQCNQLKGSWFQGKPCK